MQGGMYFMVWDKGSALLQNRLFLVGQLVTLVGLRIGASPLSAGVISRTETIVPHWAFYW